MGWILRRGISCCRWAREDCHLVLCGLERLALSHWERRALVQEAMVEGGVVLRKALLLLESGGKIMTWSFNPTSSALLSITLVKPDGNTAGIDPATTVSLTSVVTLHSSHIHHTCNHLGVYRSRSRTWQLKVLRRLTSRCCRWDLQRTKVADTAVDRCLGTCASNGKAWDLPLLEYCTNFIGTIPRRSCRSY